jgi:DNA-binding transcriptional MerR regulator
MISAMPALEEQQLTIDQLAQRTGMTARNLREWQSLGLLPPPEKRGRTGFYGPRHLTRLARVRELHAQGFRLDLIRRLLDADERGGEELVRFGHALLEPFQDEQPEVVGLPELTRRFRTLRPAALDRSVELGLLRPLGRGRYEISNPRLARIGEALIELGLTLEDMLDLAEQLRRHQEAVAEMFIGVYRDRFWEPFLAEGKPEGGWAEIRSALERLRPLALDAVTATFALAMDGAAERAIEAETRRLTEIPGLGDDPGSSGDEAG